MFTFITDGPIICERCQSFFCSYGIMHSFVDADSLDISTKQAFDGTINRVTCPVCSDSFTYESPMIIYSHNDKFAICAHFYDEYICNGSFETLIAIAGMKDWKFRRCTFSMFAFEKLRIFKNKLDDTVIEQIKLTHFPQYRDMDLELEYIVYESHNDKELFFSKKDFTGKTIKNFSVPMTEYRKFDTFSTTGKWQWANREETIKITEVTK